MPVHNLDKISFYDQTGISGRSLNEFLSIPLSSGSDKVHSSLVYEKADGISISSEFCSDDSFCGNDDIDRLFSLQVSISTVWQ